MEEIKMNNQSTIDKLREMHLSSMAEAFKSQTENPDANNLSFDDRFGMIVDIEYDTRKNNKLKRIIKNADLEQQNANIFDINYECGRKLNKDLIRRLSTCEYISSHKNVFITGATGSGKTYIACALGMEACKRFFTVKYVRLPDLFMELTAAEKNGSLGRTLNKYTRPDLLIFDEWLLTKPDDEERKLLFEIIHKRTQNSSTIFCSQYQSSGWYERLGRGNDTLADAIMDRIVYDSYKIEITNIDPEKDISMRAVYGIPENEIR